MYVPQDIFCLKEIFQSFRSKMVKVGELVGTLFPLLAKSFPGWALADRGLEGKWVPFKDGAGRASPGNLVRFCTPG